MFKNLSLSLRWIGIFALLSFSLHADEGSKIWIESYNLENFFNPNPNPGKKDEEFTANGKTRWTWDKVKIKLGQVKAVFDLRRPRPDIFSVVEIEDKVIAEMVAKELGYPEFIISNSPDERGINVATFYQPSKKIKLLDYSEHVLEDPSLPHPTRNILEAKFRTFTGQKLNVFNNHWPSQRSPAIARIAAAKRLKAIADQRMKEDSQVGIIASGDFNTLDKDHPHPFSNTLLVANGGAAFSDIHEMFMREDSGVPMWMKYKMPKGTYFYAPTMDWNVLDRFFINQQLVKGPGLKVDLQTYEIVWDPSIMTSHFYDHEGDPHFGTVIAGVPRRYDHLAFNKYKAGFSDHFAIRVCVDILGQLDPAQSSALAVVKRQ